MGTGSPASITAITYIPGISGSFVSCLVLNGVDRPKILPVILMKIVEEIVGPVVYYNLDFCILL